MLLLFVIQDTVVRWSAAKGIGRITSCLTSALSEEILSSVLELFSSGEVYFCRYSLCIVFRVTFAVALFELTGLHLLRI